MIEVTADAVRVAIADDVEAIHASMLRAALGSMMKAGCC
jgi:hypothetical protein